VLEDDAAAVADEENGAGKAVLGDVLVDERGDRGEVRGGDRGRTLG
jgi:hypothetical protein